MRIIDTLYGTLKGVVSAEFYPQGKLKACIITIYSELETEYGKLIPQYEEDQVRRKYTSSVSFYESGKLKSIVLNDQTVIHTMYGEFAAEKITFYENGVIKRLFPLDGKITGYWTEDNEYTLAKEYTFNLSCGAIKGKIISLHFYPSWQLKSISLWPKERVVVKMKEQEIQIRTGISFYESGKIKSCEPAMPTEVLTPIGKVMAYDTRAIGIHGENNSLVFDEQGRARKVVCSTDLIEIYDENNIKTIYSPQKTQSLLNPDKKEIVPLYIAFYNHKVSINEEIEYALDKYSFVVKHYYLFFQTACGDCSNCNLCS